jgi:hypothetical protein
MPKKNLLWLLLLLPICASLMRYRAEQKVEDDYKDCQLNLKNLATALEMYSTDNAGRYPHDIGKVVPMYLKQMPVCPGADPGKSVFALQTATNPDAFSICCSGFNHRPKITAANYPQYHNTSGILER